VPPGDAATTLCVAIARVLGLEAAHLVERRPRPRARARLAGGRLEAHLAAAAHRVELDGERNPDARFTSAS
jgi:hypothetical protein